MQIANSCIDHATASKLHLPNKVMEQEENDICCHGELVNSWYIERLFTPTKIAVAIDYSSVEWL